jgi:glycerate kinase
VGCLRALYPCTQVVSGFEFIAEEMSLASKIADADLIITGEGCYDAQT